MEERIPWFKMPLELRALSFSERREAIDRYEAENGEYIWEDHFPK